MKQYKRGIQAYKTATSDVILKDNPTKKKLNSNNIDNGFIKTTPNDSKFRKVAKLLLVLGKKEASNVLTTLPSKDIEKVSKEISNIDYVGRAEALELLKEFGKEDSVFNRNKGGVETARTILVNAFGQEKGNKLLYSAVPECKDKPFSFLNDLDDNQRILILRKESVSTLTIVLNYLEPKYSSPILESLSPDIQKEIIRRLSKLKRVSPNVIKIITENLIEKIKLLGKNDSIEIDGRGTLADILKYMDVDNERKILNEIDTIDPHLGEIIRDRLYTIDIIYSIEKSDFQKIIQELSDIELVYLIKGESKDIQNKIWNSMSEGRKVMVQSEMDVIGLVKKSDADKMTKKFIKLIKEKEENGHLRIITDEDWVY